MNLKEPTEEQKLFAQIIDLLCEDGWQKLTRVIDNCYVFVMDDSGSIFHRYLKWDSDYSEWHGSNFWYPGFWLSDRCHLLEDIDDSTRAMVVCTSVPIVTAKTKDALKLLENHWNSFDD